MDEMTEALVWCNQRWSGMYEPRLVKSEKTAELIGCGPCMIGYAFERHFHVVGHGKTWRAAVAMGQKDPSVKFHQELND